ncbi:MAG: Ig-like domain-containing protein [Prevotellaceae bacterium]|jgi:hypothetical protein|nr:Ig-like domain-containing protein [Prevotellaceae bacterium]
MKTKRIFSLLALAALMLWGAHVKAAGTTPYADEFPVTFVASETNISAAEWVTYTANSYSSRTDCSTPQGNYPNLSGTGRKVDFYLSNCGDAIFTLRGNGSREMAFYVNDNKVEQKVITTNGCEDVVISVNSTGSVKVSVSGVDGSVYLPSVTFTSGVSASPTITATPEAIAITTPANAVVEETQKTVTVSGVALTGNLSLAIQGEGDAIFSLPSASETLTAVEGAVAATAVVLEFGDYSAAAGQTLYDTLVISGGDADEVKVPLELTVTAVDESKPVVTGYFPVDEDTNVFVYTPLYVVFDKNITVNDTDAVVIDNGNEITSVAASNDTLFITALLVKNTTYTITLGAGAVQDLATNKSEESSWSFTTDGAAPTVVGKEPEGNTAPIKPIKVTFSEPVEVVGDLITVNGGIVGATLSGDRITLTLTDTVVGPEHTYAVVIPKEAITDISGNELAENIKWTFTALDDSPVFPYKPTLDASFVIPSWMTLTSATGRTSDGCQTTTGYALRTANGFAEFRLPQCGYFRVDVTANGGRTFKMFVDGVEKIPSTAIEKTTPCGGVGYINYKVNSFTPVVIRIEDMGSSFSLVNLEITAPEVDRPAIFASPEAIDVTVAANATVAEADRSIIVVGATLTSDPVTSVIQVGGAAGIFAVPVLKASLTPNLNGAIRDTLVLELGDYSAVAGTTLRDTLVISGGGADTIIKIPLVLTVTGADITAPVALAFFPVNEAVNVPVNTPLYVVFSEPVTVDPAKVTIDNGVTVSGVTVKEDTLFITAALVKDVTYTVALAEGAVKDAAENESVASSWSFTTDNAAPVLSGSAPADNAAGAAINVKPSFTFNEKVTVLTATVADAINDSIDVTLAVSASGTVVTVTPAHNFEYLTEYALTIPAGSIADISGNEYATDLALHFTTKKQVEGLFYTDFLTAPDAVGALVFNASNEYAIGAGPVVIGNMTLGGHSSAKLQGSALEATPDEPGMDGATDGRFSTGGQGGYVELPSLQGPCMIYFWHAPSGANSNVRGLTLTANGANLGGNSLATATATYGTTSANSIYRKDSALYAGTDMVTFRLTGGSSGMWLLDVLVKAIEIDDEAPVLAFTPADGATGVASNATLVAAASKPMYRKNDMTAKLTFSDLAGYVTLLKGETPVATADLSFALDNDTIKVALENGARWENGATYTLKVDTVSNNFGYKSDVQSTTFTIVGDEVFVSDLTITSPTEEQEIAVGATVALTATVTPDNATDKSVSWELIGGGSYATLNASAPSVTGVLASGSAAVQLRARANGADGNLTRDVYFYVRAAGTGITKSADDYGIVVSPIPTDGLLNVNSNVTLKQVKVYAASSSALVLSQPLSGSSVDLSALPAGSYIVLLFPETGAPAVVQVVKQ